MGKIYALLNTYTEKKFSTVKELGSLWPQIAPQTEWQPLI